MGVAVPALEVRTNTTGTELDPDGYTVVVDGAPAQPIGVVDTVIVDPLATGPHTVSLGGLADNCSVAGDATVQVTVTSDQTAVVEYAVVCGPTQGQIVVTTGTTGDPVDPDGYSLKLDDTTVGPIGVNETQTLRGVPPGDHQVTLEGVALNCTVAGDNPRTVSVTAGEDAAVAFAVTCAAPAGTVHVSVATSGSPIDPDGYLVSLDGAASGVPIAAIGSVNLTGVPVGSHSVALTGLAANCASQSPNPVTVDVPLGGSVDATFTVSCLGNSQVITFGSSAAGLLGIFVVSPDGSGLTNLTPEGTFERNPIWSPDGHKLLFARLDPSFTSEVLYTMNPDGTDRTPLEDGEQFIDYRWSPDGSRIAYSLGRSANGGLRSDLWVIQADGSGKVKLASDAEGPSWSPDGSQVAYVHDVGDVHIRIINSDGGNDHPLTEPSLSTIQPAWSPDGSRIAFTSLGRPNEIMVINPDGSGLLNLTNGLAQEDGPVWSPDGTRIAFNTGPEDQPLESDVAVVNPDGSGRINLTNRPGFDLQPDWSPDGRQIVFVRMDLDNEIYVMNSDGSNPIDVSNRPDSFESAPDWGGQALVAVRSPLARFNIRSLRLAAMMERRVKVGR